MLPTGIAIESPSTQRQWPMMFSCTEAITSRSIGVACPRPPARASSPSSSCPRGRGCTSRTTRGGRSARCAARGAGSRRVVGDDDRARAEHRARLGHRLERVGQVELGLGQHRGRGAARKPRLDLAAVGRAAREALDDLAGRDPELDLVVAGALDAARDRDDLRPGRLLGPEVLEPLGAVVDDVGDVGEGLDVVDQRRAAVEALDRGERGLQARVAALALERVEQRRLLAADVGAGAAVDDELDPTPVPSTLSPR